MFHIRSGGVKINRQLVININNRPLHIVRLVSQLVAII